MGTRTGAWVLLAALSAFGSACSSPETLSGPGGSCLMATDCQLGFVCYKSACTSNLAGLVNIEDAGGSYDAPVQVVQDVSMPPPVEAGIPETTPGPPTPLEASTTIPDATQPPAEASSPAPMPEAATPTPDASPPGSMSLDAASGG